jgi:hypothetical protein
LSIEDELLELARARDAGMEVALSEMDPGAPNILRSQLRAYLSRQADHGRIKHAASSIPEMTTLEGGVIRLSCHDLVFVSGSTLTFEITLDKNQAGWIIKEFQFHVRLRPKRKVSMVRIHLNETSSWHDALRIPRCHFHVDESEPHLAFPILNPRLLLHVMCEQIEPDFGT